MTAQDESSTSRMQRSRKDALLSQMRGIDRARPQLQVDPVVSKRAAPRFEDLAEYKQVQIQKMAGDLAQIGNPFYRTHDIGAGATTKIDGRNLTNFASCARHCRSMAFPPQPVGSLPVSVPSIRSLRRGWRIFTALMVAWSSSVAT